MGDIIKDAKKLQSELQSERADWVRERGGENIEMPLDCTVMYEDEEAREVIGALAEETWEYQVQARSMKCPAWEPSTNAVLQKWYGAEDIEEAKGKARTHTPYFHGRENVEVRVLRRRVSKPEVVNE